MNTPSGQGFRDTQSGPRFLIVDDEPFNLSLLTRHLEAGGYQNTSTANDADTAERLLSEGAFDLVMLDIDMPGRSGLETLRWMKQDMRIRHVPVLMISGIEETSTIADCIQAGAEDFLRKPFDPTILQARIESCLDRKRLRDQEVGLLRQLRQEKQRTVELMNVILPPMAAAELRNHGGVVPRRHENVAVLFADLVGFTAYCDRHPPETVLEKLQFVVQGFEQISKDRGLEKIKTIGDAYMATAGLLVPNPAPIYSAVQAGLDMAEVVRQTDTGWQVRVGVNLGTVISGIVGDDRYQFDVWGDAVNLAARMESAAEPGTVAVSYDTWLQIEAPVNARSKGRIPLKGKGELEVILCSREETE